MMDISDIITPAHEDLDQNLLDEMSQELERNNSDFSISVHVRNSCYFLLCKEKDKLDFIYPLSFEPKYRFESGLGLFGFLMENELSYYSDLQEFLSLLQDRITSAIDYIAEPNLVENHLTQIIPFPRCNHE
jgi:hypothetical protein